MNLTYIILGAVVLLVLFAVGIYNKLVRLRTRTSEAWADIDVQLKRRYDLIPNLVNTVKGYTTHESAAFENVSEARAKAMGAGSVAEKGQAENMLAGALKSIFAISEAYPELKANQNFLELQRELSDTENKIQASRRFYNTNVRDLNIAVETFPSNVFAGMFGFTKKEFFELEAGSEQKENTEVKF
ncbi:hypothetical protein COW81_02195 [Candidatus Campbellbacteria bacterium CG22_combo_CG10-13_8_21_14_all_36_13]|uniref:LemA family protein n=1 Tax=Candidatus Campbellbacteria bacterium CG22_combo_CG10-13_8_21_14_all_36_13 TaxID=1974529 RepID=A0A2H0DY21_9BACT|nr:MAG: hypothetical protein COW81_02195 [Candidatus Campbellbacteria bacterium CG22_combo_CG10-13_8_21_14_all_36_13]